VRGDVESIEPAGVRLTVLPPVWMRGWFLALVVMVVAVTAVSTHRIRLAIVHRHARELTREVAARTKNLQEAKRQLQDSNLTLEQRVADGIEALREAERMAAYGTMVASMAHEVRHPIFSLKTVAYVLKKHLGKNEAVHNQLRILDRGIERMSALMDDLLEFARPPELAPVKTDPTHMLHEAAEEFVAAHQGERPAKILFDIQDALPGVALDPGRMAQVFINLMENAQRHAEGVTTITLGAAACEKGIVFRVSNDGAGIPEEIRSHMFEPFFTGGKGTGLGLAIVQRVVRDHGGSIQLDNGEGGGAVFSITIPHHPPESPGR